MIESSGSHIAPIIWVEIGRLIPSHFWKASKLCHALHPNTQQILVTDKRLSGKTLRLKGCGYLKVLMTEEPIRLKKIIGALQISLGKVEQSSFWINTLARFYYLHHVSRTLGIDRFIHLESDCILLNRETVDKFFAENKERVAFPLQTPKIGCASIFLVNGFTALESMITYFENEQSNDFQDDMQLLGKYADEGKKVLVLNSNLEGQDSNIVFDAQNIGRFYMGTDARNQRWPFSSRGILDSRRLDQKGMNIPINFALERVRSGVTLTLTTQNANIQIINIHFHSKNLPSTIDKLERICRRSFQPRSYRFWLLGRFDSKVFLERAISFVSRRIFRTKMLEMRLR